MDSNEQECEPLDSANVMNTAEQCLGNIGPESSASTTFVPLTQTDWVGWDESMSSPADSPASPSASQERREARKTTVTSGRRCSELLHSRDPLGSLLKTLLVSSRWHSTMCSLTWKAQATPRGRLLFRLQASERRIAEIDYGSLLPTPTAMGGGGTSRSGERIDETPTLQGMARKGMLGLWPTPTATPYGSTNNGKRGDGTTFKTAGKPSLQTMAMRGMLPTPRCCSGVRSSGMNRTELMQAVRFWPTPTAGDAKGSGSRNLPGSKAHAGVSLTDFVRFGNSNTPRRSAMWPTPTATLGPNAGLVTSRKAKEGGTLVEAVSARTMWPTPAARDFRYPNLRSYEERGGGAKGEQLPNVIGGPLSPRWVEWLMGYPDEWTACDVSAMPSSRRSSKKSAGRSSAPAEAER